MKRFLYWLKPGLGSRQMLEQKNANAGLIAFHGGGVPSWSMFENGGSARNGFCRNPVVYRCVSMISETAASVPLKVCEDRLDCDEHPLLDVLARPNMRQSGAKLLESLYAHLLISGNAYLTRIHLGDDLREIHVLDPQKVSVTAEEQGWPVEYTYASKQERTVYRQDRERPEVLHLSLFNPLNETDGLSPVSAAHMALDIHNSASAWNKALLDNSARPSGALVYASAAGENLTDDQFNRLKGELEEGYTGAGRAGRPMVLEGGLDWKSMGFSPRDMDFLQAKNGAAREIALAFGVPPMLLGIPGDNTYSNYREANLAFWRQTVMPLVEKTARDLGIWLSADFGPDITLAAATDHVSVFASEREMHWNRIDRASFLTSDEKREILGFSPLEDDDVA
ncbi:MAG: phage portal protein [Pseudomonadota bacterium]